MFVKKVPAWIRFGRSTTTTTTTMKLARLCRQYEQRHGKSRLLRQFVLYCAKRLSGGVNTPPGRPGRPSGTQDDAHVQPTVRTPAKSALATQDTATPQTPRTVEATDATDAADLAAAEQLARQLAQQEQAEMLNLLDQLDMTKFDIHCGIHKLVVLPDHDNNNRMWKVLMRIMHYRGYDNAVFMVQFDRSFERGAYIANQFAYIKPVYVQLPPNHQTAINATVLEKLLNAVLSGQKFKPTSCPTLARKMAEQVFRIELTSDSDNTVNTDNTAKRLRNSQDLPRQLFGTAKSVSHDKAVSAVSAVSAVPAVSPVGTVSAVGAVSPVGTVLPVGTESAFPRPMKRSVTVMQHDPSRAESIPNLDGLVPPGTQIPPRYQRTLACSLVPKLRTGTLFDMLGWRSNIDFKSANFKQQKQSMLVLMRDVMLGIAEMNSVSIMHGDLHCENIAVCDKPKRIQIIDLNEAVVLDPLCLANMSKKAKTIPEWLLKNPLRWVFVDKYDQNPSTVWTILDELKMHAPCMDMYTFFMNLIRKLLHSRLLHSRELVDWLQSIVMQCRSDLTQIFGVDTASINYHIDKDTVDGDMMKQYRQVAQWFILHRLFVFKKPKICAQIMNDQLALLDSSGGSGGSGGSGSVARMPS